MTIRTFAICLYGGGLVAISTLVQYQGAPSHNQTGALNKESLAGNQAALSPAGKALYTGDVMAGPSNSAVPEVAQVRKITGNKRSPVLPGCRNVPRRAEARRQSRSSAPRRLAAALSVWAKRLRHVVPRRKVA